MQPGLTSSNGTFRRNRVQTISDFDQGNRMLDAVEGTPGQSLAAFFLSVCC
jgi:hypothetical protein